MTKPRRITKREIGRRLEEAWQESLEAAGIKPDPRDMQGWLKKNKISLDRVVASGLSIGMALGMRPFGESLAKRFKIKNEEELENAVRSIKYAGDKLPSALRQAMKTIASGLPRRGGPGRQPKLSPKEAAQVCDHIMVFIRQKHTLKQALQKVSEMTECMLGKKVSPRTLQKAWDNRDEFATDK